jgi:catechol 2,3-dioxygenase-like lactoylglutathione lyase family enzyme
MNTEVTIHPKLQHYGLITSNLDAMINWYGKVLGMAVNRRTDLPEAARNRAPFSAFAFISNDEVHHRIVFFEVPALVDDPDKSRHARLQHVAFECRTLDDLLGTYVRLKSLGIVPLWGADHGLGISLYYADPDQNVIELNINNYGYGDEWTATEHMRTSPPGMTYFDPEKMLAARKAGASPWNLHQRAIAGELTPTTPPDPRVHF